MSAYQAFLSCSDQSIYFINVGNFVMEPFREEKSNEGSSTTSGLQNIQCLYEFNEGIYQHYMLESDNLILNSNTIHEGKIPWRRKWQPSPAPLPGKSHGQRSLVAYSPWGHKESDTTERLHFQKWDRLFLFCYYHRLLQVSKSATKLIILVCMCGLIRCLNLRLIKCSGNNIAKMYISKWILPEGKK